MAKGWPEARSTLQSMRYVSSARARQREGSMSPPSAALLSHLPGAGLGLPTDLRQRAKQQLGGGRAASVQACRQKGWHAAQRRRQQQLAGLRAHIQTTVVSAHDTDPGRRHKTRHQFQVQQNPTFLGGPTAAGPLPAWIRVMNDVGYFVK